jgi:hypothetical protein
MFRSLELNSVKTAYWPEKQLVSEVVGLETSLDLERYTALLQK